MKSFRAFLQEAATDEFSTKGHAGAKAKANDPRFADNPMKDMTELDEFDAGNDHDEESLEQLHQMFARGGISDHELRQGVQLTDAALHRAAAALGIGPKEVKMMLAVLTQHLRDAAKDQEEADLAESYRRFMQEAAEGTSPFDTAADDNTLSAEGDYLGDLTVRDATTGQSRFFPASQASQIKDQLADADPGERQAILRPLVQESEAGGQQASDFAAEIANDTGGSYNFPWKLGSQSGFGTAGYNLLDGKPTLRLLSVRDMHGDDVHMDDKMHQQILDQARAFIPDA